MSPNPRTTSAELGGRRRSERRPMSLRLRLQGGPGTEAWMVNLSAGGMRLITNAQLELGSVRWFLIEPCEETDHRPIVGRGEVVWLKEFVDGFVAGMRLIAPPGYGDH